VVLRSLEDNLGIDFAASRSTRRSREHHGHRVGEAAAALAGRWASSSRRSIEVDENGLTRCVRGELVYEPTSSTSSPVRRALAKADCTRWSPRR
jgi:hypothetical protein